LDLSLDVDMIVVGAKGYARPDHPTDKPKEQLSLRVEYPALAPIVRTPPGGRCSWGFDGLPVLLASDIKKNRRFVGGWTKYPFVAVGQAGSASGWS
jgi:hypothetical protein